MKSLLRLALAVAMLSALPLMAYPCSVWRYWHRRRVDPFGHGWTAAGSDWGIPGLYEGTLAFAGPCCATDFHIEFFVVPRGVSIDYLTPEGGPFGSNPSTRFSATSDGVLWTRVLIADSGQLLRSSRNVTCPWGIVSS